MTIRLDNLQIHQMGALQDVNLDFTSMQGPLVALVGSNGSGKSTVLEALPGALFRQTPNHGSLGSLARTRDSWVQATVTNGQTWTIKQTIDSVSGKGEALVLNAEGIPALDTTSVKAFDGWASEHLPLQQVLFASTFAAQNNKGGFLRLDKGERKAVLLRVLGIEHLEGIAKDAREHAATARAELVNADARLVEERRRAGDPVAARAQLVAANEAVLAAEAALETARVDLRAWEAERAVLDAALAEAKGLDRQRDDIRAKIETERATLHAVSERLQNNRRALAQGDDVRAAVARREVIAAEIARLEVAAVAAESACREATAASNAAAQALTAADRAAREARGRFDEAQRREIEARRRLDERAEIAQAVAKIPAAEKERDEASARVTEAEGALTALRELRVVGAEGRVSALRKGLKDVVAGDASTACSTATAALTDDDASIELATSLPGRTKAAEVTLLSAKQALSKAEGVLAILQRTAGRAALIERAEQDLVIATTDVETATAALAPLDEAAKDAKTALEQATAALALVKDAGRTERAAIVTLGVEAHGLERLASLAGPVANADARIAELEPQAVASQARLDALNAELLAVPTPATLASFRAAPDVSAADRVVRDARTAATVALVSVERADEASTRVASLDLARQTVADELYEWNLLAETFGRDGVQAAEIDAAGPELTALINDLLHTCVGTRWTVTIDTQRTSSDGKKMVEGLDVRVVDSSPGGWEGPGEMFSGGETVLIGEAISLALTVLACRRSGVKGPTIFRDETGAALDIDKAPTYIAMLRRAAEIVGASLVLFVTHSPEIAAMADSHIVVGNGTAVAA